MILVDTSVWVYHLRHDDMELAGLLESARVLVHPFVIGELALGSLRNRVDLLKALNGLPRAAVAHDEEVSHFVDRWKLYGMGIGYVDAHLLAAMALTSGAAIWTRNKRLRGVAAKLALAAEIRR